MSRWEKLIEHAAEQTEKSARSLAVVQHQISTVEAQREQMQAYRQEYAQRAATPGTVGSIQRLNAIREFGDQVQLTVGELDNQLHALRERYEGLRDTWNRRYKREQALRSLQRIDEQKQFVLDERVRRREEDDFSLQAKRRREGR